ncbi:hypothetical protein [Dokdonella ginsengisoli]|uniref:Uncharacterized protein n=1 Tax=Dokdonella ginsengisoli TaxID=363846 RepID=A0ABV9QW17_9GAMM
MNTPRRPDDELERLLADDGGELGALYRRLPRIEPPRRLDRSVLGEAARAVHGTRPRRQRWLIGFGSAAGLVLAAGVAWHVGHEPLRQPPHEPAHGAPTYVPVQPIDAPARRHEAAPPSPSGLAAPAPAPAASAPSKPAIADEAKATRAARPALEQAAPAPRSAPPPPAAAPEPPAPAAVASPPVEAQQEAAAPAGANTTSAYSANESEALSKQAADTAPKKRERSAGMSAPSSSVELRRDTQLAPEVWLARIEQLVRQGRRQQAIESLQLFRRAHPDWQLPESLRELDD